MAVGTDGFGALKARLKSVLKPARYAHTRGVAATARSLALRHGIAPERAALAGWLHDCAKALERDALQRLLGPAGADAGERAVPALWHAPVGALLARREYGVRDPEVLRAIRLHTTGGPDPDPLAKVLFVSDFIEPGRPRWPELPALRRLARRDLDAAYFEVLRLKLLDLVSKGRPLHPRGLAAYHRHMESRCPAR